MNWNFSTTYPSWFILACLALGVLFSALLYYKAKKDLLPKWAQVTLPALRFLSISIIAFFLLGPLLKHRVFEKEKPVVLLAIDNSASLKQQKENQTISAQDLQAFKQSLEEKFIVNEVLWGDKVEPSNADSLSNTAMATNMSSVLNYGRQQYSNQNLAATIMFTDGIYTSGANPEFTVSAIKSPLYTVGLGDTTIYTDFMISNVLHNSLAYLGNDFPIRVELKATKLAGKQGTLTVKRNGEVVASKPVTINSDRFFFETDVLTKAIKLGANKIDVQLTVFDNEKNTSNNRYTFYLDVVDSRKKVEIWADAPHPDLGALRTLIQKNENYEVKVVLKPTQSADNADLVILHNWFKGVSDQQRYKQLRSKGIPILLIVGEEFNYGLFNNSGQALKFNPLGRGTNQAQAMINAGFEYFEIKEDWSESIKSWSPLNVPFGRFSGYRPSDVLLFQKIGSVKTSDPLIILTEDNRLRMGVIAGTGIWQWKLLDFERNFDHNLSRDLIGNIVQYLSVKDEKKRLRVQPTSRSIAFGEEVTLGGELYNQSLEPIRNAEISVDVIDEAGKTYKHVMDAFGDQYKLKLSNLATGSYRYSASANVSGLTLNDKGYFSVQDQQRELIDLTADHNLLRLLSERSGGKFYNRTELNALSAQLNADESMVSLINEESRLEELINLKWMFWLILVLIASEWFIRKIIGSY